MPDQLIPTVTWRIGGGAPAPNRLVRLSIGTNGYISTWGAVLSACPPSGC
ncbi:hypothetical protein [Flindersiella endophytica]